MDLTFKVILSLLLLSYSSFSFSQGECKNVEVLDSLCIQNQDNFENIISMAKAMGGKVLPYEQADVHLDIEGLP